MKTKKNLCASFVSRNTVGNHRNHIWADTLLNEVVKHERVICGRSEQVSRTKYTCALKNRVVRKQVQQEL